MPLGAGPVGIVIGYVVGLILRMVWVMLVFIFTGALQSLIPAIDPFRVLMARVGGGLGLIGSFIVVCTAFINELWN